MRLFRNIIGNNLDDEKLTYYEVLEGGQLALCASFQSSPLVSFENVGACRRKTCLWMITALCAVLKLETHRISHSCCVAVSCGT